MLPYATLTPTKASADSIHYDVSDARGKADIRSMTVHLGVGGEEQAVWNSSKFAIGDSGFYEAELTVGDASFIVYFHYPDGTMLSDQSFLSLRCTSGEIEERVQYQLRIRGGEDEILIASTFYYAP